MKILHINTYENGGAGIACRRLHDELLNNSIDSKVLVLKGNSQTNQIYPYFTLKNGTIPNTLLKLITKILNKFLRIPIVFKPKSYERINPIRNFNKVQNNELVKSADIIHLHWVANFIDYPDFLKNVNKPIIWTLHDMHPFSGGYHYECGLQINNYNTFLKKNRTILKGSISSNLIINGISKWISKKAHESGMYKNNEIYTIPNGISKRKFFLEERLDLLKEKFNIPKSSVSVLFVSDSLSNKRKGVDLFIDAINQLNINVTVILIGRKGGDVEKKLNKHIINIGAINDEVILRQIYNATDITAIPSIEDNFPNSCLESLFCGTPVIGFNSGGFPEMVEENLTGVICQEISSESLSKNLELMIDNLPTYDKVKISELTQKKFDVRIMAEKFITLYKKHYNLQASI